MSAQRCRLVLFASPQEADIDQIDTATRTGRVYAVVLYRGDSPEDEFARYCEGIVGNCRASETPVLIADNTQLMGRVGADGLLLEKMNQDVSQVVKDYTPDRLIGCGGFKDRHGAMVVGEANPDFVFIGRLGGDIKAEAHPRNLKLAEWWAKVIDIPCVVMAGNASDSVLACAGTGADFAGVCKAVFNDKIRPDEAVLQLDALLEAEAPRFEGEPA